VAFHRDSEEIGGQALPVDENGRYLLPAPTPDPSLKVMSAPWLPRPLPWVRSQPVIWDSLAVAFVGGFLACLGWRRWRKEAFIFAAIVVFISVVISLYMLDQDAKEKSPEQYYSLHDWYGVGPIVAAVFAGLAGVPLLMLGMTKVIAFGITKSWQQLWRRRNPGAVKGRKRP
jgi:hypothetical protein